jgi:hypothetical protein
VHSGPGRKSWHCGPKRAGIEDQVIGGCSAVEPADPVQEKVLPAGFPSTEAWEPLPGPAGVGWGRGAPAQYINIFNE